MLLSIVILIPLLGAWLPTALSRALGVDPARTAAALAATSLALILSQAPDVLAGAAAFGPRQLTRPQSPSASLTVRQSTSLKFCRLRSVEAVSPGVSASS